LTMPETNKLRKAISKKEGDDLKKLLQKVKEWLIIGRGWTEAQAESVVSQMKASGRYSFNKCVSADTKIFKNNGPFEALTVEQMYLAKNDLQWAKDNKKISIRNKYKRLGYGKSWSIREGKLYPNDIVDIRFEGVKDVYRLTTSSGKAIKATENHKFPTLNGDTALEDLRVGDTLYVMGKPEAGDTTYRFDEGDNLPTIGQQGFQKKPNSSFCLLKVRSSELKAKYLSCQVCNISLIGSRSEIHHIDGDHSNQEYANLIVNCPSCHKKAHYAMGRTKRGERGLPLLTEEIVKIELIGQDNVYDVEMAAPNHNFVVNDGIVTCNSHAVAYCYVARTCAYLKYYYPIEWWAAVLSNSSDDDLQSNWQYNAAITLPPDVNKSTTEFAITGVAPNERILSPLSLVKGVGVATMAELLSKRPFTSLEDMLRKVNRSIVDKGTMLKLILSGTLNQFFPVDTTDVEKMQIFLNTKATIENKVMETVPDEYRNLTPLKNFLIKKSVFRVYTEPLAPIAIMKLEGMGIASRVTEGANSWVVNVKDDYYGNGRRSIVSLSRLEEFIESDKSHRFAVIAYITKTEEKPYADNKKNRLIVNAEIDNKSFEFIKWPGWKQNTHGINEDIEDSVCVLVLSKREGSNEGIFIDELTVIENLNFLKEKKDVEQKPKTKRTKKKTGSSDEHSESGPE